MSKHRTDLNHLHLLPAIKQNLDQSSDEDQNQKTAEDDAVHVSCCLGTVREFFTCIYMQAASPQTSLKSP